MKYTQDGNSGAVHKPKIWYNGNMNEDIRSAIQHDIGLITDLVQEAINTVLTDNREQMESIVAVALQTHTRHLEPDVEIDNELFREISAKAFTTAFYEILKAMGRDDG